jgi:sterol 24-C-methyltransferase
MEFPENSFDAVFVIEATVHAPSLQGVYEQIYRVLKPGGAFGVYEWVMTDKFDENNPTHCAIRLGIERGDGIARMQTRKHAEEAIKAAGFTLEHAEDLAARPDTIRWYYPITGKLKRPGLTAWIGNLVQTRVGRSCVGMLLSILELVRIVPAGTARTSRELALAADNLVAGGEEEIFTPMYFMIAKKPPS